MWKGRNKIWVAKIRKEAKREERDRWEEKEEGFGG